ncbi:MAG: type II secretion system protein GspF, partial [Lentisphaeria bacterium]|nr:type II secretion system protein GspF [Lentisphaeria bacterium]
MPQYRYIAVPAAGGAREEVTIEADSMQEAAGKLRGRAMLPLVYLGETGAESGRKWFKAQADGYEFTSQLAPLLGANIPLERALAIIVESS